jgi:L-rhamnose-H+ transport protein
MIIAALMIVVLAGGMNGSFAAPMSRVRGWQWEHTWLVWSILGMFVIPASVTVATVPHLGAVYRTAGPVAIASTALYGMVWGAGTVLFGLGIARVGIALSFGIILGTSSSVGTLVPLLILRRGRALSHADLFVLMGAGLVLMGVTFSAWSGLLREATRSERVNRSSFVAGLIVCFLSGIGSSCMSLALNESTPISNAARVLGTSEVASLNAVWPILLGGGALVNVSYCVLLLVRHRNLVHFRQSAAVNAAWVVLMAILWSGSNFVYGVGARGLGPLGLVVGWPIFMAVIVLSANAWGVLKGEWRSAGTGAVAWATAGCLLLMVGIWIVAWAGNTG